MNNIKKRQHYVWRQYLKPWADQNDTIWTCFKELNRIERPSLMGVAQEKYFYKLNCFSEEEERFLKEFVDVISSKTTKGINSDFFAAFTSISKLKREFEQRGNLLPNKILVEEKIKELEINLMEDSHCKMEAFGSKLILCRSLGDLKKINEDNYLHEAIMFLCFQYFRTKSMKNSALQSTKGGKYESVMEKSWNIISLCFATTLAEKISIEPNLKFVFIANDTDKQFIASDQPVFNILGDKLNDKGNVIELELYYPLTPRYALNIHFNKDQEDQFESKFADKELIDYLNNKTFENADYFVFGTTKEQLEEFK